MRLAYADPPYPGCANLYPEKREVDHAELIARLERDYDGWVLHTHVPGLRLLERERLLPEAVRICSWCKPFAAFKRNVSVAYAWEPVIIKCCRKPVVSGRIVMRDFIAESITLKRGMTGAKPEKVCHWAFELMGANPDDTLDDLFPGSGAVTRAWTTWTAAQAMTDAVEETAA